MKTVLLSEKAIHPHATHQKFWLFHVSDSYIPGCVGY